MDDRRHPAPRARDLRARLIRGALALLCATAAAAQDVDPTPYPRPSSKKGLQVQMVDDALALGIRHAGINVVLGALLDPDGGDDAIAHDGHRFSRAAVARLDAQVRPLSKAGVVVSAILLATRTGDAAKDRLLLHRGCSPKAPNGIGAFATDTEAGRACLRATVSFLAARYSGAAEHGRIWNWIVGNEVNSHWWWYHMGEVPMATVVTEYERAVRIVHGAVRRHSRHGRCFVSLEHHWNQRFAAGNERQAFAGRPFLEAFAARARERGDFDWHVAFHPYPENLFDCRFWEDTSAPDRDDAARVTFNNLPVLIRFLARKPLRVEATGRARRVILSEQGFHCADGEHGERDQAAAYALAWHLVQQQPTIDAFILHRHVDHAHEGGLRLGLWSRKQDSVCTPERRRRIGDVFAQCDTEAWPACAGFALPVVGMRSFSPK